MWYTQKQGRWSIINVKLECYTGKVDLECPRTSWEVMPLPILPIRLECQDEYQPYQHMPRPDPRLITFPNCGKHTASNRQDRRYLRNKHRSWSPFRLSHCMFSPILAHIQACSPLAEIQADAKSADGCSQICRGTSKEEAVRRTSLLATSSLLGGMNAFSMHRLLVYCRRSHFLGSGGTPPVSC